MVGGVEDPAEVLLGLADVLAHHRAQVDPVEVEAQVVGDDLGGERLAGAARPAEDGRAAQPGVTAHPQTPLVVHRHPVARVGGEQLERLPLRRREDQVVPRGRGLDALGVGAQVGAVDGAAGVPERRPGRRPPPSRSRRSTRRRGRRRPRARPPGRPDPASASHRSCCSAALGRGTSTRTVARRRSAGQRAGRHGDRRAGQRHQGVDGGVGVGLVLDEERGAAQHAVALEQPRELLARAGVDRDDTGGRSSTGRSPRSRAACVATASRLQRSPPTSTGTGDPEDRHRSARRCAAGSWPGVVPGSPVAARTMPVSLGSGPRSPVRKCRTYSSIRSVAAVSGPWSPTSTRRQRRSGPSGAGPTSAARAARPARGRRSGRSRTGRHALRRARHRRTAAGSTARTATARTPRLTTSTADDSAVDAGRPVRRGRWLARPRRGGPGPSVTSAQLGDDGQLVGAGPRGGPSASGSARRRSRSRHGHHRVP